MADVDTNVLIGLNTQGLLLLIGALLIMIIGPNNFIPTLHPRVRPYALGVIALSLIWTIGHPFFTSPEEVPRWAAGGTLVSMGLFFGITFYATKILRPVIYGSIEIAAGACGLVLVALMNPMDSVLALVFGVATSIYVIVRGLTNINDALNKAEPQDPVEDLKPPPPRRKAPASGKSKPRNSPEPGRKDQRKGPEIPNAKTKRAGRS